MYHPIIKNKLNEIKGYKQVECSLKNMPIIELTDIKTDDFETFFNQLFSDDRQNSIYGILRTKKCYIDLPAYLYNQIIDIFSLQNHKNKFDFFIKLNDIIKKKSLHPFTPVISFDYSHDTRRESYKQNISFAKKIIDHFDNFAIRIFTDSFFKDDDYNLLWQLYDFLPQEMEQKATLIIDIDKSTEKLSMDTIGELEKEGVKIKKIILSGEVLKNNDRLSTPFTYDRLHNKHLERFKIIVDSFRDKSIFNYSDYTLVDKIPSKIELEPDQGFLYYPFIKYTTEDGNICMFTADNKGDYKQYKELCEKVIREIRSFDEKHCSTCSFIKDVADGKIEKFKAGSTWKYRMITHHITSMAKLC